MWLIGILALAAVVYVVSEPHKPTSAVKVTQANVAANWPTHVVVDVAKWKALGYMIPVDTVPFVGVDPRKLATIQDPRAAGALAGTVPTFLSTTLAMGQRVWIGSPVQDETGSPPVAYLPIYVGNSPTATGGFVEVVA